MLTIDEKEYDLKYLIHFDMLREILIKLSKNQVSLQKDVESLKNANKEKDYKIMKIEKMIREQEENQMYEELEPKNAFIEKEEEKREIDYQSNNIDLNNEDSDRKEKYNKNNELKEDVDEEEKKSEKKDEKGEKEEKAEKSEKEEKNQEKEEKDEKKEKSEKSENIIKEDRIDYKKDSSKKSKEDTNRDSEKKMSSRKNNFLNMLAGDKNNKQIYNYLREFSSRISQIEMQLSSLVQRDFTSLKKDLKNHDLENQSDFKLIDIKFNEFLEKFAEYDKKIEDCTVKCASIDIFNIIKDSGDGSVDAAKILFKSLEDKCFKKFDIIDARYKQEALDLLKMKKNVENFVPKLDKVNREIVHIKEFEDQQKEELVNSKKEANEQNDKTIKLLDEKNDDILKKMIELKEEIDKEIIQKIKDIEQKMQLLGKGEDGASSLFKLGLVGNNKVDEEKLQVLDKKITDVRKKANDLENSFKIFMNEELEVLKNDVKELKFKIDKKISKEDLKELYNLHLSDLDEINDLKDQTGLTCDELKKIIKDLNNVSSRVESINGNLILLQNSQLSGGRGPIIDLSKYLDQQKLTDALRPILKEIEKIYKEMDSLHREINEVENNEKLLEKKERVNKLEEDLNTKISDLKVYCNRKFPDKIDINKTIKNIEVQLKDFSGKRTDGDGWLMAKQPLKCFNCASCEANIKNTTPVQEYIPWNKYPQQERIYRMGQGFSHMLQMMTSEFVKTFGSPGDNNNTNLNSDTESNKMNKNINTNTHSILYHSSEKSFSGQKMNISNKELIKDETFNFYRTGGKVKLPKMKKFSKNIKDRFDESIPVSDEEKDYVGDSVDKKKPIITESPKIMRITKKKLQNPFNMSGFNSKYGQSIDYGNKKKDKEKDFIDSSIKVKMNKKNCN